ncbi:MAG: DUF6011 domain-containing protein [Candidatus Thorarchaeota archaeon]
MEKITCNRCGRPLRSTESIKKGYGPKCFKIIQLQKKSPENELKTEIDFLKCEINMIKRQLKNSQSISPGPRSEPIDRIKREENLPERNKDITNFNMVINELKTIFNQGDPKKNLAHIPNNIVKTQKLLM